MHGQMYLKGMKEGIPVALGYFFVSITIGIAARLADLTPMQAAVMSLTNLTSAGQFASFTLIASGASFVEMAISQAVINLRYCLMSCALSQKIDHELPMGHRLTWLLVLLTKFSVSAFPRRESWSPGICTVS